MTGYGLRRRAGLVSMHSTPVCLLPRHNRVITDAVAGRRAAGQTIREAIRRYVLNHHPEAGRLGERVDGLRDQYPLRSDHLHLPEIEPMLLDAASDIASEPEPRTPLRVRLSNGDRALVQALCREGERPVAVIARALDELLGLGV